MIHVLTCADHIAISGERTTSPMEKLQCYASTKLKSMSTRRVCCKFQATVANPLYLSSGWEGLDIVRTDRC